MMVLPGRNKETKELEMAAILNTRTAMNPRTPKGADYYDERQVAYVVRGYNGRNANKVITSFGRLTGWEVGTTHELVGDQSGRSLGTCVVEAIFTFATGEMEGYTDNRKLAHWVFK
jgi:hypothetical protein